MSGFLFFLLLTVLMSFLMNWVFMRYLQVKETPTLPKTPKEHEQSSVEQMNQYMDGI